MFDPYIKAGATPTLLKGLDRYRIESEIRPTVKTESIAIYYDWLKR